MFVRAKWILSHPEGKREMEAILAERSINLRASEKTINILFYRSQ